MISDKSEEEATRQDTKIQEIMQSKRDQYRIEIRRKSNSELINMKRLKYAMGDDEKEDAEMSDQMINEHMKLMSKELGVHISTGNLIQIEKILTRLRKFLSQETNPPLEYAFNNNFVPYLKNLLGEQFLSCGSIIKEATWCLINMSFIMNLEMLNTIRDKGTLELLMRLIKTTRDGDILLQCMWIIANLLADGPSEMREEFTNNDMIGVLYSVLENFDKSQTRVHHLQTFGAIIHGLIGQPLTSEMILSKNFVGLLSNLLLVEDGEIEFHSVHSLSLIAIKWGDSSMIQEFINCDVVNRLTKYLDPDYPLKKFIVNNVWKCFGMIAMGDENQTKALIKANILGHIHKHLNAVNIETKRLAAWTLSNIAATGENMIAEIFLTPLVDRMLEILVVGDNDSVVLEVLYCLTNICQKAIIAQNQRLIDNGLISILLTLLGKQNANIILKSLEMMEYFLTFGDEVRDEGENNIIVEYIAREGGIPKLEELQYHKEEEVYNMVVRIIEAFFASESVN